VVEVAAGGRLFLAELVGGSRVAVVEELEVAGSEARVYLYQAIPKGGRMDLVVEKATEVGATGIVPLLTKRGVVSPREGKVERWRRVAEAAARQSLGSSIPEVTEPLPFQTAVREAGESGVLLHNLAGLEDVEDVVEPGVRLFVGPEGGWDEAELEAAVRAGMAMAQLGSRRLRSETAGIVGVSRARAALERRVRVRGGV
jgi:16S rRNA (uracil1498-N3)-methyltransferase